ncbi:hypothetical protein ACQEVF_47630 [Nonomuraea polychroma]|uniref:hypothetical protein n=1 Tax=Nonomuraea polychroma TaxID=46176 RepID=UPI003D8B429E
MTELLGRGVKVVSLTAERQAEGIAAAKRREATGAMLPGKKKTGRSRAGGPAGLATLPHLDPA